jgi:Prokaryotic E2 family E
MSSAATVRCPLPEIDYRFLEEKGWQYEVVVGPGEVRVYIRGFELPAAYAPRLSDLLVRLPMGYPQANPDMFWTRPDVLLARGGYPNRADYHDPTADGWQRWSRHGGWRPGVDNLRSKLAAVKHELEAGS